MAMIPHYWEISQELSRRAARMNEGIHIPKIPDSYELHNFMHYFSMIKWLSFPSYETLQPALECKLPDNTQTWGVEEVYIYLIQKLAKLYGANERGAICPEETVSRILRWLRFLNCVRSSWGNFVTFEVRLGEKDKHAYTDYFGNPINVLNDLEPEQTCIAEMLADEEIPKTFKIHLAKLFVIKDPGRVNCIYYKWFNTLSGQRMKRIMWSGVS